MSYSQGYFQLPISSRRRSLDKRALCQSRATDHQALKVPDTYFTASRAGEYDEKFSTNLDVLGVFRIEVATSSSAETKDTMELAINRRLN